MRKILLLVNPYSQGGDKKEQVKRMFNNIAHRYDYLNHMLSAGIDRRWRKKTIKQFDGRKIEKVLDIATGTGDLAIAFKKKVPNADVIGLDLSEGMIELGIKKLEKNGQEGISLIVGDAENLPFENEEFDAITVAFGVRNFGDLQAGLKEMQRVLKSDGRLCVLEFSEPQGILFKPLFQFYFKYILPKLGRFLSKDPEAYDYLFKSVQAFPAYERFMEELNKAGFQPKYFKKLTFGICTIYVAEK